MSILRSKLVRYIIRKMRLPNDEENVNHTIENIKGASDVSGAGLWVLAAAIFIASLASQSELNRSYYRSYAYIPVDGANHGFWSWAWHQ